MHSVYALVCVSLLRCFHCTSRRILRNIRLPKTQPLNALSLQPLPAKPRPRLLSRRVRSVPRPCADRDCEEPDADGGVWGECEELGGCVCEGVEE